MHHVANEFGFKQIVNRNKSKNRIMTPFIEKN